MSECNLEHDPRHWKFNWYLVGIERADAIRAIVKANPYLVVPVEHLETVKKCIPEFAQVANPVGESPHV